MESTLKFLVVLVICAGILWVVSPLVSSAVSGGMQKDPDLKISGYDYEITPLENTECSQNMCSVRVYGTVYNFGGPAKNIILTVFFNEDTENIGSTNLPIIASLGGKESEDFSFTDEMGCGVTSASVSVMHSERA